MSCSGRSSSLPAYLDKQVRLKTSMTPAARWGPIVQAALVVAALAVLFAAILHNGWLSELNRRLSRLAKNVRSGAEARR